MRLLIILLGVLIALALLVWLGLQIRPRPFEPYPARDPGGEETIPLPTRLPEPVERFYRELYGQEVPVIDTAVVSGRAGMRIAGITFPARFRFAHEAGRGYRHYIEATLFGIPLMRVNETYLDGRARLELPFGITEDEPRVDQAANLGLWAEGIWFPAIFVTDERVTWEGVDAETALLTVPFGDDAQTFVVRFDPASGLPRFFESMRYKEADDGSKSLWLNEVREWGTVAGYRIPVTAALTWYEDGSPWAVFEVEEVVYNAEVSDYLRGQGP